MPFGIPFAFRTGCAIRWVVQSKVAGRGAPWCWQVFLMLFVHSFGQPAIQLPNDWFSTWAWRPRRTSWSRTRKKLFQTLKVLFYHCASEVPIWILASGMHFCRRTSSFWPIQSSRKLRRAVRSDQGKRRGPQKKKKQEGGGAARGLEKGYVSLVEPQPSVAHANIFDEMSPPKRRKRSWMEKEIFEWGQSSCFPFFCVTHYL